MDYAYNKEEMAVVVNNYNTRNAAVEDYIKTHSCQPVPAKAKKR